MDYESDPIFESKYKVIKMVRIFAKIEMEAFRKCLCQEFLCIVGTYLYPKWIRNSFILQNYTHAR